MKFLALLLIALAACKDMKLERQKEIADKVNRLKTTWTAKAYDRDFTVTLGAFLGHHKLPKKPRTPPRNDLPESYDLRTAYPNCEALQEVRDQSECGSCWAFGAAEAMSDRICIQSKGEKQTRVSTQYLLACCWSCGMGCGGGWSDSCFDWWMTDGIPSGGNYGDKNSCQPYWIGECKHHGADGPEDMPDCGPTRDTPDCEETCQEGYPVSLKDDLTFGLDSYGFYGDEEELMQEIYERGSIAVSFSVYEDFVNYRSGIYQHVTGDYLGGHAVKCIGWGVENGTKYWIIMNSWNKYWGENGAFRIIKGVDECGIETGACAGNPAL